MTWTIAALLVAYTIMVVAVVWWLSWKEYERGRLAGIEEAAQELEDNGDMYNHLDSKDIARDMREQLLPPGPIR